MRKSILGAVFVLLLVSSVPALAQLDGIWAGQGTGLCNPPPWSHSDFAIYPWQNWKGRIANKNNFSGDWHDKRGNRGEFVGPILYINEDEGYCYCAGDWGLAGAYMGTFSMYFYYYDEICYGEWNTSYSAEHGTMHGEWIED